MRSTIWTRCAVLLPAVLAWNVASAQEGRGVSGGLDRGAGFATPKYLPAGSITSDLLAINPYACEGWDAIDGDALRASDVQRYCVGLDCILEAPVELPTGAVVTRIELDAVDNGPSNVKINFNRCAVGAAGCSLLAELSTSGTPGSAQISLDLTVPEIIDNQNFTYLVEIVPGQDSLTRLVSARLLFSGPVSPIQSDILAIPPHAFEARTANGRNALLADGIQRYCSGTACVLVAPVELPSGASITRIELDAHDDGSSNVEASFARCQPSSGICTSLASVSTNGTPGNTQPGVDLGSPVTIDNANYTYMAEVSLGATSATRLVGLRLSFDAPASPPGDDWLAINPFAHEGMEASDIDVLEATGGERYCSGQDCDLIAPVELPSGTIVSRIELDAFDNGPANVQAVFSRCPKGQTTCTEVATLSTSETPGAAHEGLDLAAPETIDNSASTYQVAVHLGDDDGTRLRAIRLAVKHPRIFRDGFETGDTSSWSTTVP